MFLTPDEIRTLTGRARPRAQAAALRRLGIRYVVNAAGHVVVSRANAERRLDSKDAPRTPEPATPNFAALHGGA